MGQPFQIFNDDAQAHDDQKTVENDSTEIYELDIIVKGIKEKFIRGKASSWIKWFEINSITFTFQPLATVSFFKKFSSAVKIHTL